MERAAAVYGRGLHDHEIQDEPDQRGGESGSCG